MANKNTKANEGQDHRFSSYDYVNEGAYGWLFELGKNASRVTRFYFNDSLGGSAQVIGEYVQTRRYRNPLMEKSSLVYNLGTEDTLKASKETFADNIREFAKDIEQIGVGDLKWH